MDWSIEFIEDKNYVKIILTGDFNASDHLRMIEDTLSQKYWKSHMGVLLDNRNASYLNTSIDEMRKASDNMARFNQQIGMGKAAVLMGTIPSFGKGRQFEMPTDEKSSAFMRVFMDESQVIEWLTGN